MIYLASPTLSISGTVSALGGSGGLSSSHNLGTPYGSAFGGDGGDGRICLDSDSLSGSSSPTAGHAEAGLNDSESFTHPSMDDGDIEATSTQLSLEQRRFE